MKRSKIKKLTKWVSVALMAGMLATSVPVHTLATGADGEIQKQESVDPTQDDMQETVSPETEAPEVDTQEPAAPEADGEGKENPDTADQDVADQDADNGDASAEVAESAEVQEDNGVEPCIIEEPYAGLAVPMAASEDGTDPQVDIVKRAQWDTSANGDGKITLNYSYTPGTKSVGKSSNVIIVQDKSGSMDSNYGYNLVKAMEGYGDSTKSVRFPLSGEAGKVGYTESGEQLMAEGAQQYRRRINTTITGYHKVGDSWQASATYEGFHTSGISSSWSGAFACGEYGFASPCQNPNHYYFIIEGTDAGKMVNGKNLYNVSQSDYHHYIKMYNEDGSSNVKGDLSTWLANGNRVLRVKNYITGAPREYKNVEGDQNLFIDVSCLEQHNGKWVLQTTADSCQDWSRLERSQELATMLMQEVYNANEDNQIAYIPFWGDVPNNGTWTNRGMVDGSFVTTHPANELTRHGSVSSVGLTSSTGGEIPSKLSSQVNDKFTYNGTNWSIALRKAIEMINGMTPVQKSKQTIVIFMTDGVPQGYPSEAGDMTQPAIDGSEEIKTLQGMDNVILYACGICMEQGNTDTLNRLKSMGGGSELTETDNKGRFVNMEDMEDFDKKAPLMLAKVHDELTEKITAHDAYYVDTISGNYEIDESKLKSSEVRVLDSVSGRGYVYNSDIPEEVANVYYKNANPPKAVYVKSTKTLYWYLGGMTEGGYSASGHEFVFPIKYNYYQTSTSGKYENKDANTQQYLSYMLTGGARPFRTETAVPKLQFSREDPASITVTKTLKGADPSASRTFRYVYSKTKQTSGKVTGAAGTATVTIPAGATSGTAKFTGIEPGTYYVYEVDNQNNIINPTVHTVTIKGNAVVTTAVKSSSVPASVTSSDIESRSNRDNRLTITTGGASVEFEGSYITFEGTKKWEDNDNPDRPGTYTVRLYRNGTYLKEATFKQDEKWHFDNLDEFDARGVKYVYTIKEAAVDGYEASYNEATHVLTNTLVEVELPDTGSTTLLLLFGAAVLFVAAGSVARKKSRA